MFYDSRRSAPRGEKSRRQLLEHVFCFPNPAHARKDVLHRKIMRRGAEAGHSVFHKDQLVAAIEGGAGRGFDPEVGCDSTENNRLDPPPAELLVELRAVESAPLPFCDQQVADLISTFRNNL